MMYDINMNSDDINIVVINKLIMQSHEKFITYHLSNNHRHDHAIIILNIIIFPIYIQNIVNTTSNQLNGFLDQWKSYVTNIYHDYDNNITNQLESLCVTTDKIYDEINNNNNINENNDIIMLTELKEIEKNTLCITNDVNTMIINYKNEDKIIKNNIKILQSKMLTECKKQVGMLNNIHHHSSKQQGQKLLKVLKGMQ